MAKKIFENISNAELRAKGVAALADKPNVPTSYGNGNLSPAELKLWFDNLGRLLANKINEIQDALSQDGQEYIGIDNLGADIASLKDLTESFLNGSFATILQAYHSAAERGDENNLATLQTILDEKARLISELTTAFEEYKKLIKSKEGAAEVGLPDDYDGENKKLSDLIADIANGTLATKLSILSFGFTTPKEDATTTRTLKEFADLVSGALRGDIESGLLEKITGLSNKINEIVKNGTDKVQDVQVNGESVLDTATGIASINVADLKSGFVSVSSTDPVWVDYTLNGTVYKAIRVAKTDAALGVFNQSNQEIIVQKAYDDNCLYLCVGTTALNCTLRKMKGGSVNDSGLQYELTLYDDKGNLLGSYDGSASKSITIPSGGKKYLHCVSITGVDAQGQQYGVGSVYLQIESIYSTAFTKGTLVEFLRNRGFTDVCPHACTGIGYIEEDSGYTKVTILARECHIGPVGSSNVDNLYVRGFTSTQFGYSGLTNKTRYSISLSSSNTELIDTVLSR